MDGWKLTTECPFVLAPYPEPTGVPMAAAVLVDVRPGRQYEEEERANRSMLHYLMPSRREFLRSGLQPGMPRVKRPTLTRSMWRCWRYPLVGRVRGVRKIVELHAEGRKPDRPPDWRCGYCRLLDDCAIGQAHPPALLLSLSNSGSTHPIIGSRAHLA